MDLITDSGALAEFCRRQHGADFVAVDTEFMRERTFWPILCLVQIAGPNEAAAIDATVDGIDLAPLLALMNDPATLKVFHAARQDLEIFFFLSGQVPHPVFDTQVAAMVLGYGESISYDQLVQRITGDTLDKSNRFTDWTRRPLTAAQLKYAVSDVTHLRDVYLALSADIDKRGRTQWVKEEMKVLTSPDTYRMEPENAWLRLKTRARKPKELAVLMEVAAWREREAQARDVPRGPDRASGGELEPSVLAAVEIGGPAEARVGERLERQGARVGHRERHRAREVAHLRERLPRRDALDPRQLPLRQVLRCAEVDLDAERGGDLVGEEAPERAALRVDAPHELALVPA